MQQEPMREEDVKKAAEAFLDNAKESVAAGYEETLKKYKELEEINKKLAPLSSPPTAYGWLCPACGRGNAPWQSHCSCTPVRPYYYPSYPPGPWWGTTTPPYNYPPPVWCGTPSTCTSQGQAGGCGTPGVQG